MNLNLFTFVEMSFVEMTFDISFLVLFFHQTMDSATSPAQVATASCLQSLREAPGLLEVQVSLVWANKSQSKKLDTWLSGVSIGLWP